MIHNGWCDLGSLQTYFIFASAPYNTDCLFQMIQWFKCNDSNHNKPIFGPTNEDPALKLLLLLLSAFFKLLSSCFLISLVKVSFKMFQDREKGSPNCLAMRIVSHLTPQRIECPRWIMSNFQRWLFSLVSLWLRGDNLTDSAICFQYFERHRSITFPPKRPLEPTPYEDFHEKWCIALCLIHCPEFREQVTRSGHGRGREMFCTAAVGRLGRTLGPSGLHPKLDSCFTSANIVNIVTHFKWGQVTRNIVLNSYWNASLAKVN